MASLAGNASAYILVYGDGSSDKPYRISTCAQLDSWVNQSGTLAYLNFLITNNLDCTGYTFDNTTMLTGSTIDGGNHRIENINIGPSGLVYSMNLSTIKNLWLKNGNNFSAPYSTGGSFTRQMVGSELNNVRSTIDLVCSGFCGGLVGIAQESTITSSVYDGTLDAGSYSGGLVGSDFENGTRNLTISKSAFLGTMTAPSYAGGIIGSYTENSSITDSYVDGVFDLGPYSGGIIGAFNDSIAIVRSYSAGSGVFSGGSGGIVGGNGNQNITVAHSYATLNSSNNNTIVGNVEGLINSDIFYADVRYLDETDTGRCRASDNSVDGCTKMSFGQADTMARYMGWNFTDIWQQEIGKQPTLRLTDFNDPAGIPNGGDMNADDIQDTFQGNIELLKNEAGQWTAIETKDSNACTLGEANLLDTNDIPKNAGYNIISDYVGFNVYCLDQGQSFTTNIYLDRSIDISNVRLLYYNPINKTYTPISGATFTHKTIGGQTFTVLSYTLTDGGPYDRDGVANGKIEDPVVLANPTSIADVKAPNTGVAIKQNYTFQAISLLIVSLSIIALSRKSTNYFILNNKRSNKS